MTTVPTSTQPTLPDLVIKAIQAGAENTNGAICTAYADSPGISVEIKNQGDAIAGPFVVTLNLVRQSVSSGLAPGDSILLWYPGGNLTAEVWVDAQSQVIESDEGNNRATWNLTPPTLPAECIQTPTPVVALQEPLTTLEGHKGQVLSVAFSPDGNLVVSGSVDNTMRLWLIEEGRLFRTMQGHTFPFMAVRFSPNGVNLATGSMDGLVRVWQVSNGTLLRTLKGHAGWVTGLDFSKDGKYLVSGSDDFTVRVWRLSDYKLIQTIDEGMGSITSVAFSPDATKLAWSEIDGKVRLRSFSGVWLHILEADGLEATRVAFSPQGDRLAAGYSNGSIRIWSVEDGALLQTIRSQSQAISGLAFSPDGKWLVSGSRDNTLVLWRLDEAGGLAAPALNYIGHVGPVTDVDFSPLSNLVVSGSEDGTIRLWPVPGP